MHPYTHSLLFTVLNKCKTVSVLPEIKEIQSLCTADSFGFHSLFSWVLQDAASDMPSLRVSKIKVACGSHDPLQHVTQLYSLWKLNLQKHV